MFDHEKQEQAAAKIAPLLRECLDELKTPMYADRMKIMAMDRMAKYRAHIDAGFTEAQALELCKS